MNESTPEETELEVTIPAVRGKLAAAASRPRRARRSTRVVDAIASPGDLHKSDDTWIGLTFV
jgi:hypothetical protein